MDESKLFSMLTVILCALSLLLLPSYIGLVITMYGVKSAYPMEIMKCYKNGRLTGIAEVPEALLQDSVWFAVGCTLCFSLPILLCLYFEMLKQQCLNRTKRLFICYVLLIIICISGSSIWCGKLIQLDDFAVEIKDKDWDSDVFGCRLNATVYELQKESDDLYYWVVTVGFVMQIAFYAVSLLNTWYLILICPMCALCVPCIGKGINKCCELCNNCKKKRKLKQYMKMKKKFFKERNKILNNYLDGQEDCIVIINNYLQDLEFINHLQDETTFRRCYMNNIDEVRLSLLISHN
eukprot:502372_1